MADLNKVQLIGRLGKDPEIRTLNSGARVASFSIATGERWTDKQSGEKKEKTDWHNVVVFNEHLVKVVDQYCKKGSQVYVEGKLQTRKWQDNSGQDRYSTEVVMPSFGGAIQLLGDKSDGEGRTSSRADSRTSDRDQSGGGYAAASGGGPVFDDEIPF